MAHPKYILKSTADDHFYFKLTDSDGEVILTSPFFINKSKAVNGIVSVQINSGRDERYARNKSASGQFYFSLKANNGQVIGTSETYSTREMMEVGIGSVRQSGLTHEIEDQTLIRVA